MIPIYSPKDNSLHSISLGCKCIYAAGALVSVMIINHPVLLVAGLLSMPIVFFRAGEIANWFWYLRIFFVLGIVYFLITVMISNQGDNVLFWRITYEEIVFGISFVLKLILSLSVFILFSLTVHPDDLLQKLGRRTVRSALALSIAVRLFPTLIKDANDIYEAYLSRGIPLDQGNWFLRWMSRIRLMIPLLVNSLERTNTLAESMECRGFGRMTGPATACKGKKPAYFFRSMDRAFLSMVTIILPGIFLLLLLTQLGGWGMKSSYTIDLGVGSYEAVLGILLLMIMAAPMVSAALGGGRD